MLKYQISLCNVWWNKNDINTRYFDDTNSQITYFENLTSGEYSPLVNFNMGDFIETTIIYKDSSSKSPEELVRSNYAVVKRTETVIENDEEVTHVDYRFFFAKCYQDSGRQMRVELSLDDIQTNYFKHKDTIKDCLINRAHIDRWKPTNDIGGEPAVRFNNDKESLLFKKEPVEELPQLTYYDFKIKTKFSGITAIDTWLNKYVKCWLYVYIKNDGTGFEKHQYKCKDFESQSNADATLNMLNLRINDTDEDYTNMSSYGVLVYPIYYENTTKFIKVKNGNNDTFKLGYADFENISVTGNTFTELNNDTSYVISKKLSLVCPFTDFTNASIVNDELVISRGSYTSLLYYDYAGCRMTRFSNYDANNYSWTNNCTVCYCTNKSVYNMELDMSSLISSYINNEFKVSSIVGATHSIPLNPKIHSSQCMKLKLHGNSDDGFEYDLLQLGKYYSKVEYTETLQPEITRYFARINTKYDSSIGYECVIPNEQKLNYVGDVGSMDATLPLVNSKYAEFIANNKNFWLQQNANMITGLTQGLLNDIVGTAGMTPTKNNPNPYQITNVFNAPFELMNKATELYCSTNSMKNAPGSLKNANTNVLFAKQVNDLNIHATITQALYKDLQTFDDYTNKYGFAVGIVDNISNYDNIRKYFNYIECQVEVITAPISDEEKNRLREKLSAIRFWNSDTIQYTLENYEKYLEQEVNNG